MRPVRHNLKAVREKPDTDDKEKLSEYGRGLIVNIKTVGDHIIQQTRNLPSPVRETKQKHLWYHPCWSILFPGVLFAISGRLLYHIKNFKECMKMWLQEKKRKLPLEQPLQRLMMDINL